VLSSAIVGLVLSVLIVAATYTLFSYRFQINIPPAKPLLVILPFKYSFRAIAFLNYAKQK